MKDTVPASSKPLRNDRDAPRRNETRKPIDPTPEHEGATEEQVSETTAPSVGYDDEPKQG